MAQLIVRNLDDAVKRKLQRRAARHGRSMEEEIRDILRNAVKDEGSRARGWVRRSPSSSRDIEFEEPIRELRGGKHGASDCSQP